MVGPIMNLISEIRIYGTPKVRIYGTLGIHNNFPKCNTLLISRDEKLKFSTCLVAIFESNFCFQIRQIEPH